MKSGALVELAPTERLFGAPEHPYTAELLSLMPRIVGQEAPNLVGEG